MSEELELDPLRKFFQEIEAGKNSQFPGLKLSQSWIGRKLTPPVSPPVINQWLKKKYKGRVDALEDRLSVLMNWMLLNKHQPNLAEFFDNSRPIREDIFATPITSRVLEGLRMTKRQGHMSAIVGDPGLGKSSALTMFRSKHDKDSFVVTLNEMTCPGTKNGLVTAFWESRGFDKNGFKASGMTRAAWIADQFSDGKTLVIIDNSHLLKKKALDLLVGFHEATRCPLAFVGNRELLDTLQTVERCPSHVGFRVIADFKEDEDEAVFNDFVKSSAKQWLEIHWPKDVAQLQKLAETVLRETKCLRKLRNVSTIAAIFVNEKGATVEKAWHGAMKKQLHNFKFALAGSFNHTK